MSEEEFKPGEIIHWVSNETPTLRDRFACSALGALIIRENSAKIHSEDEYQRRMKAVCEVAFEYADAMLAQRKKDA